MEEGPTGYHWHSTGESASKAPGQKGAVVPTYEYACKDCGEHLEVHQSFSDAALTECPACHGPLRKVFGNIAITFKGSGFYKTDSRAANGKGGKAGDGKGSDTAAKDTSSDKSGDSSGTKSDAKGDSKGAATSASKSGDTKAGSKAGDAKAASKSASPSKRAS